MLSNTILLQAASGQQSALPSILMIVLMIAIFYFFMIRPQQKRIHGKRWHYEQNSGRTHRSAPTGLQCTFSQSVAVNYTTRVCYKPPTVFISCSPNPMV